MPQDTVIIDICGTIYDSNTTFDFLDFFFKKRADYSLFRKLTKTLLWKIVNKLFWKLFAIDVTRIFAVKWVKGYKREELKKMSDEFFDAFLVSRTHASVIDEIEKHRSKFSRMILASATLDFIADTVSDRMNIPECFSTSLEYDTNGICMGKITDDLLGNKLTFLMNKGIMPPYSFVITDNLSDIDVVMKSASCAIIMTSKTKEKWKKSLRNYDSKRLHILCV